MQFEGPASQGIAQTQVPFTLEENIHQLNAIDKSIAQLMSQSAIALHALTIPALDAASASAPLDLPAQKEAFKSATDSFLTTLHGIDVRMKRQIMALEEAGIVNLAGAQRRDPSSGSKSSLKPSGSGAVGKLDVGWLNSRSTRVEREMEAELWQEAKQLLQKVHNSRS